MVIIDGGPQEYAALAYGEMHPGTLAFLENQVTTLSDRLTESGRAFMAKGYEVFQQYNGAEALRFTKAALRSLRYSFEPNRINYLDSIGSIQQAQPVMQRWIMACPEVRKLYHQNRIDGYSETYVDAEPNFIGHTHTDYQTVMSGLVQDGGKDDEFDYRIVTYTTDEEAQDLMLSEKIEILSTWDAIRTMLKPGSEDPTSIYAANM